MLRPSSIKEIFLHVVKQKLEELEDERKVCDRNFKDYRIKEHVWKHPYGNPWKGKTAKARRELEKVRSTINKWKRFMKELKKP